MIRYKIDIVKALKDAGYKPQFIRDNNIFGQSTMTKFNNNDTNITLKNINTICQILNCQPSDLIEFIPDSYTDKPIIKPDI